MLSLMLATSKIVRFIAIILLMASFFLLIVGALVTSKGAGMSVPDWPTTYGYNMFLFPYSKWIGGIFYEHLHRLIASLVGILSLILLIVTFLKKESLILRKLACFIFLVVLLQGIVGGLRVTLYKDQLGIFHALLAQLFLSLLFIFLYLSSNNKLDHSTEFKNKKFGLKFVSIFLTVITLFQMSVAATIRHQHLPLAVPDFPLAYGSIFPNTSSVQMQKINTKRVQNHLSPVSRLQIHLHITHRYTSIIILLFALILMYQTVQVTPFGYWLRSWILIFLALIIVQIFLGALTVIFNKPADIATAHMVLGSFITAFIILITFRLFFEGENRINT